MSYFPLKETKPREHRTISKMRYHMEKQGPGWCVTKGKDFHLGLCCLMTGIRSEKRVIWRLCRCVNVTGSTPNLGGTASYTARLCGTAYRSWVTSLHGALPHRTARE